MYILDNNEADGMLTRPLQSSICSAVDRLSVRLPGASGKNLLIGVVQATGSTDGPDYGSYQSLFYFFVTPHYYEE